MLLQKFFPGRFPPPLRCGLYAMAAEDIGYRGALRPTSLARTASRLRWLSVKRSRRSPICSRRTRFFFDQVINSPLLVLVQPTCDAGEGEREWRENRRYLRILPSDKSFRISPMPSTHSSFRTIRDLRDLADSELKFVPVSIQQLARTVTEVDSCEKCYPEADISFDWIRRAFVDAKDYIDYILPAHGLCPECGSEIHERRWCTRKEFDFGLFFAPVCASASSFHSTYGRSPQRE